MGKKTITILCLLILTGCGNQLVYQAVHDAKIALDSGNYERAKSLLIVAREEGAEDEVGLLQNQLSYLITMRNHLQNRHLDQALLEWTELNLSPSESRIIKDEAQRLLTDELTAVADRIRGGGRSSDIEYGQMLVKRLAIFEKFQLEITTLQALFVE